jgi:hypothetical protein
VALQKACSRPTKALVLLHLQKVVI